MEMSANQAKKGEFREDDRDTRFQSKTKNGLSSIPLSVGTSSLKHQRRSDKMVSFRDYEICLLFLLLVKFYGSGKYEIYSSVPI